MQQIETVSALPNVGPYIYMTLAFLALLGAPYIYDISSLRVKRFWDIVGLFRGAPHKNAFICKMFFVFLYSTALLPL